MSNYEDNKVDELWEKSSQNDVVKGLKEGKNFSEILTNEQIAEAFKDIPCCLGCSDGRIHDHRIGRAGMGILAGVEETVASIKAKVEAGELPAAGFTITSHAGCGAAKIVCNKLIAEGKLPANTNPDDLGIKFAEDVTASLWQRGIKAGYRHIEGGEMDELHDERGVYLDGTGKLNIENVSDKSGERLFPRGFIFTDLSLDRDITIAELKALCGIARGDHGFGHRFDKENPFYIFVSAKNQKQYEDLKKIADEATEGAEGVIQVKFLTIQSK